MSLTLADANPRFDLEISASGINPLKFSGSVGLDGLYRKGQPAPFGVTAFKGTWSDDHARVIDAQFLGAGEQRKWTLSTASGRCCMARAKECRDVSIAADPPASH